jgi:hypothetical protein
MKVLVPWLLFAVSGAFNVFFVAGMVLTPKGNPKPPGPEDRAAFLARKLDLDDAQREAVLALEKKVEEDRDRIATEHDARWARLVDELAKESPREEVIKETMETGNALAREKHFVEYLRAVMKILRPEQRGKAAEWFRKGHGGMGRGRPPGGGSFGGSGGKDAPPPR